MTPTYLIFNLEQLFHRHFFIPGDPYGPVHAAEAAATAVLVEEDVIKPDLHEGGARRQHHLIMALSSSSAPGGQRRGVGRGGNVKGKEGSLKQSCSRCEKTLQSTSGAIETAAEASLGRDLLASEAIGCLPRRAAPA